MPQDDHPVIDLIRDLIVRVAAHMQIKFDHARLIGGFLVLLLLVFDAFCDASYDGDGDYGSAEEET
jgi:hypothetical protein